MRMSMAVLPGVVTPGRVGHAVVTAREAAG